MIRVFISYRRDDSRSTAEKIYKRLTINLGQNYLFLDQYAIPLGSDFREVLTDALYRCDMLVAVIGPQWINIADQAGERRLEDESDWVRCEIETALQRDIPIIPILINQARMPRVDELPEGLTPLASRNALIIRSDPDFERDMEVLIRYIQQWDDKGEVFPGATVGPTGRVYPAPKRFVSFLALFCPWLHFHL